MLAVGFEVPTQLPFVKRALQGISRAHAATGTPRRVRRPVSWDMFLQGEYSISTQGQGGRVLWLCLGMSLFFFFNARSEEVVARDGGAVHPTPGVTLADVASYDGKNLLGCLKWRQADRVEVRFRGHKGDQAGVCSIVIEHVTRSAESVRDCDRTEPLSLLWWNCCRVAPFFPNTPLSSYRCKGNVVTWQYGWAMNALRYIVWESEGKPEGFAWHSLRIGETSELAAGGVVSEREIQREGRWKSDAYKIYTRNNTEDASQVSRKLAKEGMGSLTQPGQDTVWGKLQRERTASGLEEFE